MLMLQECVPYLQECIAFPPTSGREKAPLRTAYIGGTSEALSVPWIRALPGKKNIRFFCGQVFVIQRYLGFKAIRGHICWVQGRSSEEPVCKSQYHDCFPAVSDMPAATTNVPS